jgi:ubiquinone/menaquinone biosynthesis C-methylase UbiE
MPSFFAPIREAEPMGLYVHGYSETEAGRLADQADTLAALLHTRIRFPKGSRVLEAGCGVGAQTTHLVRNNPECHFTAFDASADSVQKARTRITQEGFSNVQFDTGDVYRMSFEIESFDHAFICFLLEHLNKPLQALSGLKNVLKTGGTISVIEGDHGSYYCHPRSEAADHAVRCLIEVQARKSGNALIGRQLYPLLREAGFRDVQVTPRMVYVDASHPGLVDGFTRKTFIAMVKGVKQDAVSMGLTDDRRWDAGIADLYRATAEDGTFCYTFFQAVGRK